MTNSEITKSEFADAVTEALSFANDPAIDGQTIDSDIAWEHFQADRDKWTAVDEDNHSGSPGLYAVLTDGPWWVPVG